jgi:hypothetical protein
MELVRDLDVVLTSFGFSASGQSCGRKRSDGAFFLGILVKNILSVETWYFAFITARVICEDISDEESDHEVEAADRGCDGVGDRSSRSSRGEGRSRRRAWRRLAAAGRPGMAATGAGTKLRAGTAARAGMTTADIGWYKHGGTVRWRGASPRPNSGAAGAAGFVGPGAGWWDWRHAWGWSDFGWGWERVGGPGAACWLVRRRRDRRAAAIVAPPPIYIAPPPVVVGFP